MKIQIGQAEYKLPFQYIWQNDGVVSADGFNLCRANQNLSDADYKAANEFIAAALNAQTEKDAEIKRLIDERYELAKDLRHQMKKRLDAENDAYTKGETLKSYDKYEIPALKQKIASLEAENKRLREALEKYAEISNWDRCREEVCENGKHIWALTENGFSLAQEVLKCK